MAVLLSPWPAHAAIFTVNEGFELAFMNGNKAPFLANASLSSAFSDINAKRPEASGLLTLRDRDIATSGGEGGGFVPTGNVILDFSDGEGSWVTFEFKLWPGTQVGPGSSVGFDVVAYGGDGGTLHKFISSDGVSFTAVGGTSDAMGSWSFPLPTGGTEALLRVQVGDLSIFDGVHIDNITATINAVPEPRAAATFMAVWLGGLAAWRRRRR
ncbi:MAG: hypothetical protein HS113_20215 [Verrucomicrobiales bacterium]|nr:hypothetical protein [Verrucomicrobiales bacterium]